jgi:hypothetical protein
VKHANGESETGASRAVWRRRWRASERTGSTRSSTNCASPSSMVSPTRTLAAPFRGTSRPLMTQPLVEPQSRSVTEAPPSDSSQCLALTVSSRIRTVQGGSRPIVSLRLSPSPVWRPLSLSRALRQLWRAGTAAGRPPDPPAPQRAQVQATRLRARRWRPGSCPCA